MIVLEKYGRYNRETGRIVGGSIYASSKLAEPTEEFLKAYYTMCFKNGIRNSVDIGTLNKLDFEELKIMFHVLKSKEKS